MANTKQNPNVPDARIEALIPEVKHLEVGETITQIISFGNRSIACLTTNGRVLIPGENFGQWHALPVPPPAPSSEK